MHILLRLVLSRPQLLVDHAQAYGDLMAADLGDASAALSRRAILGATAVMCLLAAVILAGVSLMLWAAVPTAQMGAPWMLIVVPLAPLLGSVTGFVFMRGQRRMHPFDNLRAQLRADLDILRESSAS